MVADRYGAGLAVFERFATARLAFPDGLKMDIATTRRESYAQPALLPTVQPASIEEDLSRRDFTINAVAVQLNPQQLGRVLDPSREGNADLRARIRSACCTQAVFRDDPTRIFRAIRFERRFGFRLERTTVRLLAQAASTDLIQRLSGPRLRNEIFVAVRRARPGARDCAVGAVEAASFPPPPSVLYEECEASRYCRSQGARLVGAS